MEIYFETLIFVSPLTFCFFSTILRLLFINPPASQCPREQLHREVSSQSEELQRPAGRHRGQSKVVQITKKGKETLPVVALPPTKGSVCLCCSHELQPPGKGLLCLLGGVRVSQRFLTLKAETKQVPRHAIQFT